MNGKIALRVVAGLVLLAVIAAIHIHFYGTLAQAGRVSLLFGAGVYFC